MNHRVATPIIRMVDCIQIPVPDLAAGLEFYCTMLGHELLWWTETAARLRLPESDAEIVIQTERDTLEPNFLVASVTEAAAAFVAAGGNVIVQPFDILIGQCVVVQDAWGNQLVLLDMSKGRLVSDENHTVIAPGVL